MNKAKTRSNADIFTRCYFTAYEKCVVTHYVISTFQSLAFSRLLIKIDPGLKRYSGRNPIEGRCTKGSSFELHQTLSPFRNIQANIAGLFIERGRKYLTTIVGISGLCVQLKILVDKPGGLQLLHQTLTQVFLVISQGVARGGVCKRRKVARISNDLI